MAKKITKRIRLDLSDIDADLKAKVKKEIGEFVVDSTLEDISKGRSPVKNESAWARLSKPYADSKKGGDRTPNMELTGEMLDNYGWKRISGSDDIEVGVLGGGKDVIQRTDSHNHHIKRGKAAGNPKRRFIPKESQTYTPDITREIREIVKDAKETQDSRDQRRREQQEEQDGQETQEIQEQIQTEVQLEGLFQEETLIERIAAILNT